MLKFVIVIATLAGAELGFGSGQFEQHTGITKRQRHPVHRE
jgi:hypothetical protein